MPPGPISLGILPPGRPASGRLTLKNASVETIRIERVETSCPCIRVSLLPAQVEGGSEQPLTVTFDPTEEPEFRGGLRVEVIGREAGGATLFRTAVVLEVGP